MSGHKIPVIESLVITNRIDSIVQTSTSVSAGKVTRSAPNYGFNLFYEARLPEWELGDQPAKQTGSSRVSNSAPATNRHADAGFAGVEGQREKQRMPTNSRRKLRRAAKQLAQELPGFVV